MYFKKEVLEKISKALLLPYNGDEQDWDLEMANPDRLDEFIRHYNDSCLNSDEEKKTLMALILSSYDDFLNKTGQEVDNKWFEIRDILKNNKDLFVNLIDYWSLDDEVKNENLFKITKLVREIKAAY